MEDIILCAILTYFLLTILCSTRVCATSDISVTASLVPSQKIETNAVFAVHCQINGLQEGKHRVEIFKIANQRSVPLSTSQSVNDMVDERVLLAVRQMEDSSVVYFLTITGATQSDEAEYSCKVTELYPTLREVASDAVNMELTYFPANTYPVCEPNGSDQPFPVVHEGDKITLSCHSETGNPIVNIGWQKGSYTYQNVRREEENGRIYASVDVRVKASDNGAVFVCEITSNEFPLQKQTCHYGPLSVIPNQNNNNPNVIGDSLSTSIATLDSTINSIEDTADFLDITTRCQQECKQSNSSVMHWIITTIIASVLAFIFLIFAIVLVILKTCRSSEWDSADYHEPQYDGNISERMYREIDSRRDGGKMYMSLVKSYPDSNNMPQVPEKIQVRTPMGK